MAKKVIRLTESNLRRMVKECVTKSLNEWYDEDDYGRKLKTMSDLDPREIVGQLPQMGDKELEDIINNVTYEPQDFSTEYDDGWDDYVWVTREAEEEYAKRHKDYAMKMAVQNSKDGKYYNPKWYRSPSQDREVYADEDRKENQAKSWDQYEIDNETPVQKRLSKYYQGKSRADNNYYKGLMDWGVKHVYNGRKPDREKLHTKGSLNRELRSIDKSKK